MANYVDLTALGNGPYVVVKDGVDQQGTHVAEREAAERVMDLKLTFPNSDIGYRHDYEVLATLTDEGRDLVDGDTTPEPDPDPQPDPDPDPQPDPDPEPPTEWSEYREIPDPSVHMGFDVFADYPVDETLTGDGRDFLADKSGTASKPYVYDLGGHTVERLGTTGNYIIVQNGKVRTTGEGPVRSQGNYVVFRDIDVGGNNTDHSHGAAVTMADNSVWLRGKVHNFGVLNTSKEQDQHGFKIQAKNVWILDVETYELSGDGAQIGDASRGSAENVYIGGGWHHDNRENAIDIKDSRNIVVSGVKASGFKSGSSSPGEAVIVHDDAYDAKILDMNISDSVIGIVSSGRSGHLIDGNKIVARRVGIQLRNTRPITVTNNDITAPIRVEKQGGLNSGDNIQD